MFMQAFLFSEKHEAALQGFGENRKEHSEAVQLFICKGERFRITESNPLVLVSKKTEKGRAEPCSFSFAKGSIAGS